MQDTYNIQEWGSWKKTDATNLKMLFVHRIRILQTRQ